jgi:hypothetical protein
VDVPGLLVGTALVLTGVGLLWTAWRGSQSLPVLGRRSAAGERAEEPVPGRLSAAAGPLGLGGAVVAAGGVAVITTGWDPIGVSAATIALVVGVAALGVAAVAAVRAGRP